MSDIKQAAHAAADWWAQQIGAPTFRNVDASSSTDDRRLGDLVGIMQTLTASRHEVSKETGSAFAEALAKRIEKYMKNGGRAPDMWLYVDYDPCVALAEVAEATGVSLTRFPWKTHMTVRPDYVIASLGYRAPDVLVWSAPDWERPTCLTWHYEGNESFDERCTLPLYHDGECRDFQPDLSKCTGCGLGYTGHYAGDYDAPWHVWEPEAAR